MRHLSLDIETFSSVDLKKSGLFRYVESPDFQILIIAWSLDGGPVHLLDLSNGGFLSLSGGGVSPDLSEMLFNPAYIKHAYNAQFEITCLSRHLGVQLPVEQWRCTMVHGLYCGYTAGLDATGKALGLEPDRQKLNTGRALIRYFCIPCKPTKTNGGRTRNLSKHDPERWLLFREYCMQDVVSEMAIADKLSAFPVPDSVQREWETDLCINARGVAVDMTLVRSAIEIGQQTREALTTEAMRLSGLDNPNSIKQLSEWLSAELDEGIPGLSKDTVAALLTRDGNSDTVQRMLEIRQELGKTSTKKYDAVEAAVCADGRVRGLLQFYGANRSGRWAGRLVQMQNLPRNYLEPLSFARELTVAKQTDALQLIYGSIPDTLSQLIRTCFIAPEGRVLIDADFSAIEARVISWLAGEQWRLEVFRTHGKIYEASASQMFGVPLEKIVKGNPEYALRQKGKVAELALGYQGSSGALVQMGALNMGLTEDELPDIVARWREANRRIRDLWYAMENAAVKVVTEGGSVGVGRVLLSREFDYRGGTDCMTILLPSGRKLFYVSPTIGANQWGKPSVAYMGMEQSTKRWGAVETYGGKLVENCIAGDSLVLTDSGWVRLDRVSPKHRLWDGVEWVAHSGLVFQGLKNTVVVDGVRMTPEHLIMAEKGWRCASSCEGYNRRPVALPDSSLLRGVKREKIPVENPMRLRKGIRHASERIFKRQAKILRLYEKRTDWQCTANAWNVTASGLCCVALNDRPLPVAHTSSLGELRRPRHPRLCKVAGRFYEFLDGYGARIPKRPLAGSNRRKRQLLPGKLPMGDRQNSGPEQTQQHIHTDALGRYDGGRSLGTLRDRGHNSSLSNAERLPGKPFILSSGCYEPVYDILNAGPRRRFTVKGTDGLFIVHNCVQAIARDCLACAIERLEAAGLPVVFHVHDETVVEADSAKADLGTVLKILSEPMPWGPDLPLGADGWIGEFFRKD